MSKYWKKGWDTVDVAKGGFAETGYEYFNTIYEIPLLKAKTEEVWYIGYLAKGEEPDNKRIFLDESNARETFESVKRFNESELKSRHRFDNMTKKELQGWLMEFGFNAYAGESVYCNDVLRKLESMKSSKSDFSM